MKLQLEKKNLNGKTANHNMTISVFEKQQQRVSASNPGVVQRNCSIHGVTHEQSEQV